jgi:WhiB family redox-sensing transcriptional regulator
MGDAVAAYELAEPIPRSDSDWRDSAQCLGEDPELFFPVGRTGPAHRQAEEAKAVCRRCTVMADCLDWAMETGQDFGVWGGTSEEERRTLKRVPACV